MLRKCIGCGEYKSRDGLIKITKNHIDGNVVIQPDSKIFGRSVYLCYNQTCINTALKKGINKSLRTNISREDLKGLLDGQLKS